MKDITGKLNLIKSKNVCSVKDTVKRMRRQATDREKIFAKDIRDKGLLCKVHKEVLTFSDKKMNNFI